MAHRQRGDEAAHLAPAVRAPFWAPVASSANWRQWGCTAYGRRDGAPVTAHDKQESPRYMQCLYSYYL